jgi:hypothetical protein
MDLRATPADEAFRTELRGYLHEAVPRHGPAPEAGDWPARRAYEAGWQRKVLHPSASTSSA